MTSTSLETKKAYYAKVRQSNYAASLRLSGFDVATEDAIRPLPPLKSVIAIYRRKSS